jgi:hypothetical protein
VKKKRLRGEGAMLAGKEGSMGEARRSEAPEKQTEAQDLVLTVTTIALAIGACLYYGAKVVLSLHEMGEDICGKAKKGASKILKMHTK